MQTNSNLQNLHIRYKQINRLHHRFIYLQKKKLMLVENGQFFLTPGFLWVPGPKYHPLNLNPIVEVNLKSKSKSEKEIILCWNLVGRKGMSILRLFSLSILLDILLKMENKDTKRTHFSRQVIFLTVRIFGIMRGTFYFKTTRVEAPLSAPFCLLLEPGN